MMNEVTDYRQTLELIARVSTDKASRVLAQGALDRATSLTREEYSARYERLGKYYGFEKDVRAALGE